VTDLLPASGLSVDEHLPNAFWSRRFSSAGFVLVGIFICILVAAAALVPDFFTSENIGNLLQRNSIIGIVACGMLVMIILGGFDLSVGANGAMTSVAAAYLIAHHSIPLGVFVALLLGLSVGLANGFFVAKVGINPFVATLGTQVLITGILFVATGAQPVYGVPESFTVVGLGRIGPFPIATLIFAVVAIVTWAVLRLTRFGHYIYAVGGNKEATRIAGVNVDGVIVLAYGLGGLYASIAGIVLLGTTDIGQPASAADWPLSAIAAVVVGGVPLSGGVGGVGRAVLGTFLLGVVANSLNLLGISPYWQPAVTGAVILIAVGLDSYQRKRRELR
jgi:ribose/xylose/arabinose/galactoside ABC-type transport system permease subunit